MPRDAPNTDDFRRELRRRLDEATARGRPYLDVQSGKLHRVLGGYPGTNHAMPTCCAVMEDELRSGDEILRSPPRGRGATLVVRYRLPRR